MYPETISTQKLLEEFHKLRIELYSRCETISELNAAQDALTLCCETVGLQYVSEHPPEPERQVLIDVSKNKDSIRGGAAMLGSDGIWYWTQDERRFRKWTIPSSDGFMFQKTNLQRSKNHESFTQCPAH